MVAIRLYQELVEKKDGEEILHAKPESLHFGGPVIRVSITNPPSGLFAQAYALIDTGADECHISPEIVSHLNLVSKGLTNIDSGTEKDVPVETYDVTITILSTGKSRQVIARGMVDSGKGAHVVVGRNILQEYSLLYNGITGDVTLFTESISDNAIIQSLSDTETIQDGRELTD